MDKKSMNPPVKGRTMPNNAKKPGQESIFAKYKPTPIVNPKFKKK